MSREVLQQALAEAIVHLKAINTVFEKLKAQSSNFEMTPSELVERLKRGEKWTVESSFLAGFNVSAEGYNKEYPFHSMNPEEDGEWVKIRNEALREALAQPEPIPSNPGELKRAIAQPVQPADKDAEIARLTACLKAANADAEKFEREWYLRGDECEQLREQNTMLDAKLVELEARVDQEPSDSTIWKARALQAEAVTLKFMAQPEHDVDYWIKQHTEARKAELELRRELASLKTVQKPAAGQSRFIGDAKWSECSAKHACMVLASPQEWKGYEARYLFTSPPQRQPLTNEEKLMCWSRATCAADVEHKTEHQCLMDYGSEIEAKHGIGDKT